MRALLLTMLFSAAALGCTDDRPDGTDPDRTDAADYQQDAPATRAETDGVVVDPEPVDNEAVEEALGGELDE